MKIKELLPLIIEENPHIIVAKNMLSLDKGKYLEELYSGDSVLTPYNLLDKDIKAIRIHCIGFEIHVF